MDFMLDFPRKFGYFRRQRGYLAQAERDALSRANTMNLQFILVETSHPGNIGAAARAIRTMGFFNLTLVNPQQYPDPQIDALASHATDVVETIRVVDTFQEAIAGCDLVIGTSARSRTLPWPMLSPKDLIPPILARQPHSIAIVFGREDRGLSNDELAACHFHVQIPTSESYMSLNLAQAVQVIAYELFALGSAVPVSPDLYEPRATAEKMQGFYAHMERVLLRIGYLDPRRPKKLKERLQRLFQRAELEDSEVDLLRGIFTRMECKLDGEKSS